MRALLILLSVLLFVLLLGPGAGAEAEVGQVEATSAEAGAAVGDVENSITDGLATQRRRCRR